MRFTGSALLAMSALASLFFPVVLADCHNIGDVCNKRSNDNRVVCQCSDHTFRVICDPSTGTWRRHDSCSPGKCNNSLVMLKARLFAAPQPQASTTSRLNTRTVVTEYKS
ncbi:hypothetical protein NA57DRAFT_56362 [Rhizodiscina lignyota]|uniref:Extracellular membrane protein CFEM domain-containing protein n=1 Tax=Rhizodiscina lignyota TaxID=1504668 RepID=A0A9P4IIB6_9PEZI|nr:hypothetical protein NA57DRAFT_56362 [Rhizodiscina lignyota]